MSGSRRPARASLNTPEITMTQASSQPISAPAIDLDEVNPRLEQADSQAIVQWAADTFGDGLVMSTSFGMQSAVMLHLISEVKPDMPVIFIDTGFHFMDTYRFADKLVKRLDINLQVFQAPHSSAWTLARHGKLWEQGADGMNQIDQIHKVEPMQRALKELGATAVLAGLRRGQTEHRQSLPHVVKQNAQYKVHPILRWDNRDIHLYLKAHDLPYHPLRDKDYASVGDWYNTLPITADQHEREGRFGGLKQECGLHVPQSDAEGESRDASGL